MPTTVAVPLREVMAQVDSEIGRLVEQVQRSRAIREAFDGFSHRPNKHISTQTSAADEAVPPPPPPAPAATTTTTPAAPEEAAVPAPPPATVEEESPSRQASIVEVAAPPPVEQTRMEGFLLHYATRSMFSSKTFVPHFFVVDAERGILIFENRDAYLHDGIDSPLEKIPFFTISQNSRGSRHKQAAVCWPALLPDDCPMAYDPTKIYFAIDHTQRDGRTKKCILAASCKEERNQWIKFLTRYIDLYIPSTLNQPELLRIPRGAEVPLHRSGVLEGGHLQ